MKEKKINPVRRLAKRMVLAALWVPAKVLQAGGVDLTNFPHSRQERLVGWRWLHWCLVMAANPEIRWLAENTSERMDATLPLFDEGRRQFHLMRYEFAAGRVRGLEVADIACGTGYGAEELARRGGAKSVTGVDIDPAAVLYARRRHGGEGLRYVCASGDGTGLPAASVDAVTSFETIEHVPDDVKLVAEFHRLLRPGGLLVISTPNQWPCADHPHHVREYDRASFLAVLERNFAVVELWNQNSGTKMKFNRGQPAGLVPTTDENHNLAECFVAVCRRK